MIKFISYKIKNLFLVKGVVVTLINRFWNEVYSKIIKLDSNQHLMILVKAEFTDESLGYRTLGHLRSVNFDDKDQFIDYIVERLSILNDSYSSISVSKITFTYIVKEGLATGTRQLLKNMEDKVLTTHRFNNMNLPITMNPLDYGRIIATNILEGFTRYIVTSNKRTYQIDVSFDKLVNNVTLLGFSYLTWTDTIISEGYFKREIGKSTIYFLDGIEVLRKQILGSKIKKLSNDKL